jgi:hypothetical protein
MFWKGRFILRIVIVLAMSSALSALKSILDRFNTLSS